MFDLDELALFIVLLDAVDRAELLSEILNLTNAVIGFPSLSANVEAPSFS